MNEDHDRGHRWMLQLRTGDDDALRDLLHHYGPRVESYFLRSGVDAVFAEDLCQEVFLRVYRARHRYEPTARFSTWLFRIVHRIAINDGVRNRWRRSIALLEPVTAQSADSVPLPVEENADPSTNLQRAELRAQIRTAVSSLAEPQRTALLLHRFEGLSYEEVGIVLGLRLPAVKSLLFRARCSVRKAMELLAPEEVGDERT